MNPLQPAPFAKAVNAISNQPDGKSTLRRLFSMLTAKDDPAASTPAAAPSSEPQAPAPLAKPAPQVVGIRKGMATELRRALKPNGTLISQPKASAPASVAGSNPPSVSGSKVKLPASVLKLPKGMLSVLRKAPVPPPIQAQANPGTAKPTSRTVYPRSRFRRDYPIV